MSVNSRFWLSADNLNADDAINYLEMVCIFFVFFVSYLFKLRFLWKITKHVYWDEKKTNFPWQTMNVKKKGKKQKSI